MIEDPIKLIKEAKKMPAVKTLRQESVNRATIIVSATACLRVGIQDVEF